MSFELTGKLIEKYDEQVISDTFKKREFVIETEENAGSMVFTNQIKFQLTQDRCDALNNYNTGDEVKVSFNLRGRKYEKNGQVNYFTNLEAWRLESVASSAGSGGLDSFSEADAPPPMDESDDLPF
ncbi:MAG: hypothetical protein Kow0079_14730 [Vicingaceae bacterium]